MTSSHVCRNAEVPIHRSDFDILIPSKPTDCIRDNSAPGFDKPTPLGPATPGTFDLRVETRYTRSVSARWMPQSTDVMAMGHAQVELHSAAIAATRARFGNEIFLRGVVEVSNFCRENCHYCGMRRDNRSLDRYRARLDALLELLVHHRPEGMTDVNIQSGEDPVASREVVLPLVRTLRRETPLGISVCLGTLAPSITRELLSAGASLYIIKFEISDANLYRDLEAPGTLEERAGHIRWLASEGWRVSSGFIAGLPGESLQTPLQNLSFADGLPLSGCSVSPFIPGDETPLSSAAASSIELTLNCMASLRLMRPDWVIPAVSALNIANPDGGYRRGLRTGANLCTINLTPESMRGDYLLYKRDRFIMNEQRILEALEAEGLRPSSVSLADHLRPGSPVAFDDAALSQARTPSAP